MATDDVPQADGLVELAAALELPVEEVRAALGGPWSTGDPGSSAWGEFTVFTGRDNPRTPGRPLVAIVVDHADRTVEVGHAVGVPLPNGRMQWALGEPRTLIPIDEDDLRAWVVDREPVGASLTPDGLGEVLLAELQRGIQRVADVATLRGTSW